MSLFWVVFLAFVVGFAMKRGGLCTYAAVLQWVQHRRAERLLTFLGAAAAATLVVLPLAWSWPALVGLSSLHEKLPLALLAGGILGLGAYLNRGCVFGTFVQLVGGNLSYLGTLLGMSAGVVVTQLFFIAYAPAVTGSSPVASPGGLAYVWLALAALFVLARMVQIRLRGQGAGGVLKALRLRPWNASMAMLVIGVGGGLLYASVSGWDYASVITRATVKVLDSSAAAPAMITLYATAAMVAGGIFAAVTAGSFAISAPRLRTFVACFAGGALMGGAAMLVPGGNDTLLLKGIPALAPHALLGYAAMVAVMLLLVARFRRGENC